MMDFFKTLFSPDGFMPHGHCYFWNPGVLWLHILSDALIALAYYSIPFTLVYFIRQRRDVPFNWMFLCFAIFIIACGTTHLLEIYVIWHPIYWLQGIVKAITALVSVPTAFLLVKLLPQALSLPSPAALKAANVKLEHEITERQRAEDAVHRLNDLLEQRVAERTQQLEAINETLVQEAHERQRLEQKSRENEKLLQAIIDNSLAVIYVKDLQGRYLLVNRRFIEIFHLGEETVIGRTDHDFFKREVADAFRAMDARVATANCALTEEESAPHGDGLHTYVSVKSPLWDDAGKPYAVFGVSTDITERKQAEEKMSWLASFPERNPNPIIELDATTQTIHYLNPSTARLLPDLENRGLEHPFLAGVQATAESLHDGKAEVIRREISLGAAHYSQTISYMPENGRLRVYSTDITERKAAEERLKTSLKEVNDLKTALDEHAIVAITDPQGRITYVNDKFCAISKYSCEELLGQDHRIINSSHHPKEFIRDLWNTITHGRVWHGEIKNKARDGSFYWVDTTIVPFLNEDGKPRQYVAIRADITERKAAEERLKASLKEVSDLKTALDEHAIVAITDPQGKITYVNDKFCAISKYAREELIGQDHRLINSGYHPKSFIRDLWTTIAHGKVWHGEIKNKAKDDSFYWVDTTIVPFLNEDGKPRQYVAIRADITARKHAAAEIVQLNAELEERVARRTAELEAANKELEAFSYSVSHDLRAPLRAINGFADIVLKDFGAQLPGDAQDFLKRVRGGGQRMGQLIDDLLAFSRLSRQAVSQQTVDSSKMVQDVLEELKPQREGRAIELHVGELPACQGDPVLLKQVWVNLLSNAIKYTRGREPAIVEAGCVRENNEDVYFVRDNGVGFDMQYVNKLFGVFQRLHRSEEFEGTGVGLAIVQRIIRRHGGRVWADAKVNGGAAFYFTLNEEKTT